MIAPPKIVENKLKACLVSKLLGLYHLQWNSNGARGWWFIWKPNPCIFMHQTKANAYLEALKSEQSNEQAIISHLKN